MKARLPVLVSVLWMCCVSGFAGSPVPPGRPDPPRVFVLYGDALERLRGRIAAGLHDPALETLRAQAGHAMKLSPLSVTRKETTPPSGDKHDYMSQAPYWWPDPKTPDGLPYVQRDGEVNPEIQRIPDHRNFDRLMSATHTLALASYLFADEKYARHAAELLRAWFLDPPTRMNPNLNFAQAVRGHNEGRGIGLIETRNIFQIVDGVGLLSGSPAWTAADQKGMEDWCAKFLAWIENSSNGREEAEAKNNHGTYYDVQVASLALFTGRADLARRVFSEVPARRIAVQIEPDGRQPLELRRTKSFGYSTMNLRGLFLLARLAEDAGVDLWNERAAEGRGIRKALDFLLPFAMGTRPWPYAQIAEFHPKGLAPLLFVAAEKYRSAAYREAALKLDADVGRSLDALLLEMGQKRNGDREEAAGGVNPPYVAPAGGDGFVQSSLVSALEREVGQGGRP